MGSIHCSRGGGPGKKIPQKEGPQLGCARTQKNGIPFFVPIHHSSSTLPHTCANAFSSFRRWSGVKRVQQASQELLEQHPCLGLRRTLQYRGFPTKQINNATSDLLCGIMVQKKKVKRRKHTHGCRKCNILEHVWEG